MKKMSLVALALALVVLPGCFCRKNGCGSQPVRKNTVDRYVETNMDMADDADIEEIDLDNLDDEDEEDEEGEDLGDIDALLDDLESDEDQIALTDEELAEMFNDYSDENSEEAFNWIDEQADDELRKLYFSFNHYGIRADQKDSLAYDIEQVKQLVAEAGTAAPTIVIEGHACQEGTPAYNVGLSEKRAKSVADLFIEAGVDKNLIKVIGRGQECPVVANGKVVNGSREDRAPNRRVEVRVIYT